jgi:hypothetical protein
VEKITDKYAYSFKNNLSVFASGGKYFYSGDMLNWNPIAPGNKVQEIIGFSNSPLISYGGGGIYLLKISRKTIKITIEPDSRWITEPWLQPKSGVMVTSLDYNATHTFELKLGKLKAEKCQVYRIEGNEKKRVTLQENKLKFDVSPGDYIMELK